ncbi:ferrochelatase hem15 [Polyrhizophydium stewartii]|uniref:Ferrochelatase n=1 Tax=Polyrhizophydium stewartii TaxID=2732419 RepID=A0ABR4NJ82_9FUNG
MISSTLCATRSLATSASARHLRLRGIASTAAAAQAAAVAGTAAAATPPPKTALLLMNMGGPHTLQEVEPFLFRLFSDKDLIPIPFQSQLAPWIAKRRTPKIQDQYAQIGGGSPIRMWTERQGQLVEKLMDKLSPETAPHKSYVAFRYAPPLTDEALQSMKRDGVQRAVALTLYPQYSCSTTGSSLNELWKNLQQIDPDNSIRWSVVDRFPTHPKLAFARHIEAALSEYPESERKDVVLLFSAHSLPMSVVNRGDPYPGEVAATVHSIMNRLGHSNPYRLVWQSQVGPAEWLGPKTDATIEGYAKQGKKHLLAIPIAFVSDHVETLFELDIEYGHLAKEKGIGFKRVESLNDDPIFIEALADVVREHLAKGDAVSTQMPLRCPSCTNATCGKTKSFFAQQTVKQ